MGEIVAALHALEPGFVAVDGGDRGVYSLAEVKEQVTEVLRLCFKFKTVYFSRSQLPVASELITKDHPGCYVSYNLYT